MNSVHISVRIHLKIADTLLTKEIYYIREEVRKVILITGD